MSVIFSTGNLCCWTFSLKRKFMENYRKICASILAMFKCRTLARARMWSTRKLKFLHASSVILCLNITYYFSGKSCYMTWSLKILRIWVFGSHSLRALLETETIARANTLVYQSITPEAAETFSFSHLTRSLLLLCNMWNSGIISHVKPQPHRKTKNFDMEVCSE